MRTLTVLASLFALAGVVSADDKTAGPVTLSVVSKKDKYVFDGGGKTPAEYKAQLESIAKKLEKGEPSPGLPRSTHT